MPKRSKKPVIAILVGAIALTGLGLEPVRAASAAPQQRVGGKANAGPEFSEFSARRRGYYYGRNDAAAIGTFLAVAGTVAAVAASRQYRRHHYGYYGGYRGYAYGGPRYYAPRYHAYPGPYYGGPYGYRYY